MSGSDEQGQDFAQFSQLPTELRLAIWLLCLPCRVVEIDQFHDHRDPFAVDEDRGPCKWEYTTKLNQRLPIASQVCQESRYIALQAGKYYSSEVPPDVKWEYMMLTKRFWVDRTHDSIHLNWAPRLEPLYDFACSLKGSALGYLAYNASQTQGASFMFDYIQCKFDNYKKRIKMEDRLRALRKLQNAAVVMRVVVIHMTLKDARTTGLFGLLGDAPVQIVDVCDEKRQDAFHDLARSNCGQFTTVAQDLKRVSPLSDQAALKKRLLEIYSPDGTTKLSLYPAIMFRLCTRFCNQPFARIDNRKPRGCV
ncbi:hypothetical protein N7456_012371 [Penicillium angulare]|uniref:2EXR domain-containing protein n=1 Tax=Penicillium angulare TaxID=116970 RepID=A0A9W9K0Y6_9EURO|nr:hypothetical protein N7456_012371 [Penicillium angulare]